MMDDKTIWELAYRLVASCECFCFDVVDRSDGTSQEVCYGVGDLWVSLQDIVKEAYKAGKEARK